MTAASNAQDVIAVLASDFTQVFPKARALKLSIGRTSKAMEHPLETGATITDHRIIEPITGELSMILSSVDYRAVYQQVADLFRTGDLLTLQTRVDSFPSMLIEKMPHEESPDVLDGVALALSLKQALFVTPQFSTLPPQKVAKAKDSDTVKRGQQQPTPSPERKGSILSGLTK
jgi:hypothetical protein